MKLRKNWLIDSLLALVMGFIISVANWFLLPEYHSLSILLFWFFSLFCLMFVTSVEDFKNGYSRKLSGFYIALSIDMILVVESGLIAFLYTERNSVNWIALYVLMISFCILFILLLCCKHFEQDNNN